MEMKAFSLSIGKKPVANNKPSRVSSGIGFDNEARPSAAGDTQLISGFDGNVGGAIDARAEDQKATTKPAGPLVIQPPKSRDWREVLRLQGTKRKNILPAEEQARLTEHHDSRDQDVAPTVKSEEVTYGLVVKRRKIGDGAEAQAVVVKTEDKPKESKTLDTEAMEALLGDDNKKKSTLVIPEANNAEATEALDKEIAELPDAATLEDYTAVPIEDFGAAILRGQGLREGGMIGRRNQGPNAALATNNNKATKLLKRRPALVGIGAKNPPKEIAELGAWGKGLKKKVEGYTPIVLRNKRTGEVVTMEEGSEERDRDRNRGGKDSDKQHRDRGNRHIGEATTVGEKPKERDRERDRSRRDYEKRDHDRGSRQSEKRMTVEEGGKERDRERDRDRSRRDYDRRDRDDSDRYYEHSDRRKYEHGRDRAYRDRDDRASRMHA